MGNRSTFDLGCTAAVTRCYHCHSKARESLFALQNLHCSCADSQQMLTFVPYLLVPLETAWLAQAQTLAQLGSLPRDSVAVLPYRELSSNWLSSVSLGVALLQKEMSNTWSKLKQRLWQSFSLKVYVLFWWDHLMRVCSSLHHWGKKICLHRKRIMFLPHCNYGLVMTVS